MNWENKLFKSLLLKWFVKRYQVNMSEAQTENLDHYVNFTAFFTRELKPNARKINFDEKKLICPVDGSVSQFGAIKQQELIQAKGKNFSLHQLLALSNTETEQYNFNHGNFITLYLAPKDYHRVHMPMAGKLIKSIYIPGRLFSVNEFSAEKVSGLFARNERVVSIFHNETHGYFAVVMVGAFIVASIYTQYAGVITPPNKKQVVVTDYQDQNINYQQGDDLGFFNAGSTVILVTNDNFDCPFADIQLEQTVRMGQRL